MDVDVDNTKPNRDDGRTDNAKTIYTLPPTLTFLYPTPTPHPALQTCKHKTNTACWKRDIKSKLSTVVTIGALGLNVFTVNYNILWYSETSVAKEESEFLLVNRLITIMHQGLWYG